MEEYLIVSCNFNCRVDVIASGQHISGLVDQLDEDGRVMIGGNWYPISELMRSTPPRQIGGQYK